MSTYEKITSAIIALLLLGMGIYSFREIKEPPEHQQVQKTLSGFDESIGQTFKIGPFDRIVSVQSSDATEDACDPLQPLIVASLHDIKQRLAAQPNADYLDGKKDVFEVNDATVKLFCKKTAEVVLADPQGNSLLLQKIPFVRAIPPQGTTQDIGTLVRINATVIPVGTATSTQPTTFGSQLIPDRFLDTN